MIIKYFPEALKDLHTFSVDVYALYGVIRIHTEDDLLVLWQRFVDEGKLVLLLGGGSNILFLEDYHGAILLNRIKGIDVSQDKNYWYLHVCSGVLWHELVSYSIENSMPGLENLALIPGYVGAAPIQNIGAYGVELDRFCEYVDVLNLDIKKKIRFTVDECQFDYRTSVFVCGLDFNYAIVAVGLRLNKNWEPILNYDGLDHFNICRVTPQEILNAVCIMRKKKLPDFRIYGNAGSFFKNPIVDRTISNNLLNHYPDMPVYEYKNNLVKLSAKWLIEGCRLRKCGFGHAKIYRKQPLVLINFKKIATAQEILLLASYIYKKVEEKFNVCLEPEVRFIGRFGEINSLELLSETALNI